MSERSRRTQLILGIAKKEGNPKTFGVLKNTIASLRKARPQLFRGEKDSPIYTPIKTEQDVEDLRNNMACGNYPLSMSDCEVIGINGDCSPTCLVLLRGECDCEDEMKGGD